MDLLDKLQQGKKPEELLTPEELDEKNMKVQKYITEIMNETGLSKKKIMEKVDDKKKDLKGLISTEGALFVISKELGVSIKKSDQGFGATPEKAPIPLTEGSNANHTDIDTKGASKGFGGTTTEKFFNEKVKPFGAGAEGKGIKDAKGSNPSGSKPTQELLITPPKPAQPKITNAIILPEQTETIKYLDIPTKQQAAMYLDLYNFVKKKVVNQTDYQSIKGKLFLKKSGWRKFINAFKISIEEIEKKVYDLKINGKEDTHAEVRVRASMPNGQTVEGVGYKSWSELYEKTLHNLVSTAWTRAVNRAVSDLVGFGEVSAEEVIDETKDGGFGG